MKPNLFNFATKELSQDAFIAWLLQWADPQCDRYNRSLHSVAKAFLIELIKLQGTPPGKIERVEAVTQRENIDIWVEVNNSHLIIIEDKVGTGQHSDQLLRYRATGEKWCQERGCQLICIYIKTYSDSALNLGNVQRQGFAVFNRRKFLQLLEDYSVESDIYSDFRDRLKDLEQRESCFDDKNISEWDDNDWKGFYQVLEQKRQIVNWCYENNPSGGFWNLVLNWFVHEGGCLYMQIEQGYLCFKVGDVYDSRRDVRTRFHRLLMSSADSDMGLERPKRFGCGAHMTVAVIPQNKWLGPDDQLVDIEAVLKRLDRFESWLKKTIDNVKQGSKGNA